MTVLNDDDLDIGATGEFSPYLKFNARTKQWVFRSEDGETNIDSPQMRMAMDLANIQTGWVRFDEGTAPDHVIDPAPRERAPRPSDRHKRGFICRVLGRSSFNGVGEFSSNAVGVCSAVRDLYRDFKAQAPGHPGEVPIVAVTGHDSFKGRYGTNYSPQFAINTWVKRPAEMPDEPVVSVNGSAPATKSGDFDDLDDDIPFAWVGALIVPWALSLLGMAA
jgi:hypothetical protein